MASTIVGPLPQPSAVPMTMPRISPIAQPVRQCSVAVTASRVRVAPVGRSTGIVWFIGAPRVGGGRERRRRSSVFPGRVAGLRSGPWFRGLVAGGAGWPRAGRRGGRGSRDVLLVEASRKGGAVGGVCGGFLDGVAGSGDGRRHRGGIGRTGHLHGAGGQIGPEG